LGRASEAFGGQIQRAAAARMFVRDAELLLIDDLSSALDAEPKRSYAPLFSRGRELTCLVVSHRRAAMRHADQVLVLEGGRLVGD